MSAFPDPGRIARKAVQVALAAVGVMEDPPGSNRGKFVDHYNDVAGAALGSYWCASFVFSELWKADGEPPDYRLPMSFPRTASTVAMADWAAHHHLLIASPTRKHYTMIGDLVLFYHASEGRIAHVGIVSALGNETFHVVSGNTNSDGSRNGIGVFNLQYTWAELDPRTVFARLPF
jgi:hypothetical protein